MLIDERSDYLTFIEQAKRQNEFANLTGADLEGADFTKADLTSANLSFANINQTNLTTAKTIDVKFPRTEKKGATLPDTTSKE